MTGLTELGVVEARDRIAKGEITSRALVDACLAQIEAREAELGAWAFLDGAHARDQADALDAHRNAGHPLGPLHGVPVGIKDIVDTADMPTENGCAVDAGRQPRTDAYVVACLRAAGAVILGKTVTTELAYFTPGKTRNPHAPTHTPGGSSSGSAAAVAAHMVPGALGSQTNGSIVRPASFCGTVGFKPTHGLLPRTGVLVQSQPLDTLGPLTRSVADAALLAEVMQGQDPGDPATRARARGPLLATTLSAPPVRPLFALVKTPKWDRAAPETQAAFAELAAVLGDACDEVDLPAPFEQAHQYHRDLMLGGFAHNLSGYAERGADKLSARMREAIADGSNVSAADYLAALDWREVLNAGLEQIFARYDAIITPAAPGEAPAGLESTGDPVFNSIWSLCGTPTVSLPLLSGASGLPVGVQLVGARDDDARLLRTARWLHDFVLDGEAATAEGGAGAS